MNNYRLPTSLEVGEVFFDIRTDYRVILGILQVFGDPNYTLGESWTICLKSIYKDFEKIPVELYKEACQQAMEFIDMGQEEGDNKGPALMDWEQDSTFIIAGVNKVAGCEVRSLDYLHWWTFMGYYQEIGEGTYNTIVSIRHKKAKGKKLEKWEQEYYRENYKLIRIHKKLTAEERAREEEDKRALKALLGE